MGASPLTNAGFDKVIGLPEAKRQMAALPDEARKALLPGIRRTVDAMAAAARAAAPVRRDAVGSYHGGALRDRIAGRTSATHLIGMVGITVGAIVVNRQGQTFRIDRKDRLKYRMRRKNGEYQTRTWSRVMGTRDRERLRRSGGVLVQPSRYGHLQEFEGGRSFIRGAAHGEQGAFETRMRGIIPDVTRALEAMGHKG